MADVFFRFAPIDRERVRPLVDSLEENDLTVWFDENDIDVFGGITSSVADGIAGSKAFVAFYSADYPQRRPCQWELTRAFLMAQRWGDPRHRVLVINPERK